MRHRKNPKTHSLPDIVESIKEHGFKATPMIDEGTETMVAGHGRCKALEQMKFESLEPPDGIELGDRNEWMVPTQITTFKTERSRDAYLVADNRLSEKGGYDSSALADLLSELAESDEGLAGTGYSTDDLDELLNELDGDGDDDEDDGGRDVDVDPHTRHIGGHKVRPPAQMSNDDWKLHLGDCLEGLRKLEDNSVDAVVTDPPAGISFMGREWDDDKGGRDHWIEWLRSVMTECQRVLKPGGHALVWALPRTSHWTAMALELAGFQIRDRVSWLYVTGFPKSMDASRAIDAKLGAERPIIGTQVAFNKMPNSDVTAAERDARAAADRRGDGSTYGLGHTGVLRSDEPQTPEAAAWHGWGTALKPAAEDWWLVRKPLDGTIAENLMKWGVGAINIADCRIGDELRHNPSASSIYSMGEQPMGDAGGRDAIGRWPSHLIVSDGVEIDGIELPAMYFYVPKPSKAETEAGLGALPERSGGELTDREEGSAGLSNPRAGAGRGGGRRNIHPTKKPIALMRYLIRLICPVGGTVVDAFAGSGTTGLAALVEGCKFIGFEMNPEYHAIASERLRSIIEDPRQADAIEAEEAMPATGDGSEPDGDPEPGQGEIYRTSGSIVESSTGGQVYVTDEDSEAS